MNMRPIRAPALTIVSLMLAAPMASLAQGITDPTRPPPSVLSFTGGKIGAPTATGMNADEGDSGLRMVTVGPAQKYAVIGGKVVHVGGMIEGAKLVEVRPNSIVLQSPEGSKQNISLYSGIEIKKVQPEPAQTSKAARGKDAKGSKKENR
jgi:hypothetical protein